MPESKHPYFAYLPRCQKEFPESSLAALRISAGGSDAAKTPQLRLRRLIRKRNRPAALSMTDLRYYYSQRC